MPRPIRRKSNNKIYHAVITGINGSDIFIDNEDRERYLDILKCKSFQKKFSIYAYCLMPNHVHILINEGAFNLSSIMKSINTAYAYYFNGKYKRKGNLFHDRYRSEPIDNSVLTAITAFIHSNPIKSGLADEITQYTWSSVNSYLTWCDGYESDINIRELSEILNDSGMTPKSIVFCGFNENELNFLECHNFNNLNKTILSEEAAKQYIIEVLNFHNLCLEDIKSNRKIRDKLIQQLKVKSILSVRQIAKILDINRGIVQRVQSY